MRPAGWWRVGVLLMAGCLQPPASPAPAESPAASPGELFELRVELSALRRENALLRAQVLGFEPWESTIQLAGVGGPGGIGFTRVCPGGQALAGLRGRAGSAIDSIMPVCSPLAMPDIPEGVEAGPVLNELSSVGGDGGTAYEVMCPTGLVAIAIRGHAGNILNGFNLVCRTPGTTPPIHEPSERLEPIGSERLEGEGTGAEGTGAEGTGETAARRRHRRGRNVESDAVGGEDGSTFDRPCPPGWVLIGFSGRAGLMVDHLQPLCGRLEPSNAGPR